MHGCLARDMVRQIGSAGVDTTLEELMDAASEDALVQLFTFEKDGESSFLPPFFVFSFLTVFFAKCCGGCAIEPLVLRANCVKPSLFLMAPMSAS